MARPAALLLDTHGRPGDDSLGIDRVNRLIGDLVDLQQLLIGAVETPVLDRFPGDLVDVLYTVGVLAAKACAAA